MISRFSRAVERGVVCITLCSVALSCSTLLARGEGEKIEFSAPGSGTNSTIGLSSVNSEFNRLSMSPNSFKQMQDDLLRPMRNSPEGIDSMQGVFAIPRRTANREDSSPEASAKARRDRDKKKNWAFSNMNDLDGKSDTAANKDVESLSNPDSRHKTETSVIEEFVFGKSEGAQTNQANRVQWSDTSHEDLRGRNSGADAVFAQSTQRSSGLSGGMDNNFFSDSKNGSEGNSGSGALRSFGNAPSQMDSDSMQKHKDNFRNILDGSFAQTASANSFRSSGSGGSGFSSQFSAPQASAMSSGFGDGGSFGGGKRSTLFDNSSQGSFGGGSFGAPARNNFTQPAPVQSVPNPYQSPFDSVIKRPKL